MRRGKCASSLSIYFSISRVSYTHAEKLCVNYSFMSKKQRDGMVMDATLSMLCAASMTAMIISKSFGTSDNFEGPFRQSH